MALGGFASKKFMVSSNKIYTFDEYENEISLNIEEQEVEGTKPSIYIKGINPENPSISITLRESSQINVQKEFNDWKNILIARTPHMLFLGDKPVSNLKFLLTQITPSNAKFLNGKLVAVTLKLSFKEYARKGVKKEDK